MLEGCADVEDWTLFCQKWDPVPCSFLKKNVTKKALQNEEGTAGIKPCATLLLNPEPF